MRKDHGHEIFTGKGRLLQEAPSSTIVAGHPVTNHPSNGESQLEAAGLTKVSSIICIVSLFLWDILQVCIGDGIWQGGLAASLGVPLPQARPPAACRRGMTCSFCLCLLPLPFSLGFSFIMLFGQPAPALPSSKAPIESTYAASVFVHCPACFKVQSAY